jgi:homoserine O-succinyltransferase/O-acetyltransferase
MPLTIDGGRTPALWIEKTNGHPAEFAHNNGARAESIKIALVNNMPDAALEDTELQFFQLVEAAAGDIPVDIKLYSLPKLGRSERGLQRLSNFYCSTDDLLNSQFDGVIITGTEPHHPNLRHEPYWGALAELLDWAEENTTSTVLSCLAAHAGVLHGDGIERHALGDKQFGVFEERKTCEHALTNRTSELMRFPHSRWNEVREDALTSCGYTVLTRSAEAGVNLFVKKKKRSLFVHFQGHPEYGVDSLLKEYRRDVKRFLRGERETYPLMPHKYFDPKTTELLTYFRERTLLHRCEQLQAAFPESLGVDTLKNTWQASATRLYRNWLHYVTSRKADLKALAVAVRAG